MNHLAGGKIGGNHTSVTDFGSEIVPLLADLEVVRKIHLGEITTRGKGGSSPKRIRIFPTLSGLELRLSANRSSQIIFIHLLNPLEDHLLVKEALKDWAVE